MAVPDHDGVWALIATNTDGCTYSSDQTLAVFEDKAVAELVAEEFTKMSAEKRNRRDIGRTDTFHVRPVRTFRAESESRVRGIFEALLREHFHRREDP